jgi:basic membrane protein A
MSRKTTIKRRPLALLLALFAVLALFAAACGDDEDGGSDTPEDTPEDTPDAEPLKIGIVAPSAQNDVAFTQSIVDAVDRVGETRGVEVNISDGLFVVEDAAAAIRGYAEDGFDLVLAHGSQYGAPLQEIAPDFPEVSFAWGTTTDTFGLPNVSAYTTRSDQGGYVMGVMAAALSDAGNIGVVGPIEVGDAKLYVDGFKNGAEAQDGEVAVGVNYIESFSDVALAQEAATSFIANGADVLTGTAQMVVGATGVAADAGAAWFGTQSNQTSLGPDIVVASQVYHWEVILEQIIDDIEGGTLGGGTYTLTLENGGLEIEFNDGYDLDPAVRTLGEEAAAGIADGSVSTGVE